MSGPSPPSGGETDDLAGLTYREALTELETILVGLESDDVDVDRLTEQVARAAALIRLCRERVRGAQVEIEHIVADLDADDLGGAAR
jgi:exodeoxyribonuclease VII small subunit